MGDEQRGWRTFGERTIHVDPYVWLGQVDVELPDGGRYWHDVVRLHRVAVMALVDERDRVLMLWRHRLVPGLIAAGEVWNAGSLVGLLHLLALGSSSGAGG